MIEALKRFEIPEHLMRMIQSYLTERVLMYEITDGTRRKQLTSGAAQGYILGPNLWNIAYDSILRMVMPEGAHLSGYVDVTVAVIAARDIEKVQWKLNQVMRHVIRWMETHGLDLATQKTELVLITGKQIPKLITMQVGEERNESKKAVKHLGIMIDSNLSFVIHTGQVS